MYYILYQLVSSLEKQLEVAETTIIELEHTCEDMETETKYTTHVIFELREQIESLHRELNEYKHKRVFTLDEYIQNQYEVMEAENKVE